MFVKVCVENLMFLKFLFFLEWKKVMERCQKGSVEGKYMILLKTEKLAENRLSK